MEQVKLKFASLMQKLKNMRNEDGVSLIEVMVSFIMIVGILTATALAMTSAFNSQATSEGRDRAVQLARSVVEQSRQVGFGNLGFSQYNQNLSLAEGGLSGQTVYNNENIVIIPDSMVLPQQNFPPYHEEVIGQTVYKVFTYITQVKAASSFDQTGGKISANAPAPKRTTVIVRWDTTAGSQEVAQTWVRTPTIAECIPTSLVSNPTQTPVECQPSS
jgi:type II secretory pathway pseudopilin PulG